MRAIEGSVNPVNQLFDSIFNGRELFPEAWRSTAASRGFPALNVWEDKDTLFVEAEVPGLKMEDLEVTVLGDELSIKGRRKEPVENRKLYHRHERGTGEFVRGLRLPYDIDANRIEAQLGNGVLSLTLPKAETAKPRKIQVKTA